MVAERQTIPSSLYTHDFVAWVEQTVAQLQAQAFDQVDWANLDDCYGAARAQAADETGLEGDRFSSFCSYKIEQVLNPDFFPLTYQA